MFKILPKLPLYPPLTAHCSCKPPLKFNSDHTLTFPPGDNPIHHLASPLHLASPAAALNPLSSPQILPIKLCIAPASSKSRTNGLHNYYPHGSAFVLYSVPLRSHHDVIASITTISSPTFNPLHTLVSLQQTHHRPALPEPQAACLSHLVGPVLSNWYIIYSPPSRPTPSQWGVNHRNGLSPIHQSPPPLFQPILKPIDLPTVLRA